MCGVVGIVGSGWVNQQIYDALTVIQHRGQDAAGIMTCDGRRVFLRKDSGLVRDVFDAQHMLQLEGNMGLGHVPAIRQPEGTTGRRRSLFMLTRLSASHSVITAT